MKKNYLLILLLTSLAATLTFSSCSESYDDEKIWDEFEEVYDRIERLETLCAQMNDNIQALQTIVQALQTQDYVTSILPISAEGGSIGFSINFKYADPITIYLPANPEPTPEIGVREDTDGIYYWTLNGEWLLDENGNKVKAQGEDGDNTTPKLKIEEGFWWVSYDNGSTWEKLDIVAEGNSDAVFKGVTTSNGCANFELTDGSVISVPLASSNIIDFLDPNVKLVCVLNWDSDGDKQLSYDEAAAVSNLGKSFNGTGIVYFDELKYFTSLNSIADNAFENCTALRVITLPESVKSFGKGAFAGCSNLEKIHLPEGMQKIEEYTFSGCGIKHLTIPESVTEIKQHAFSRSSLEELVIPKNVEILGQDAFLSCENLKQVDMSESKIATIYGCTFYECRELKSVKMPTSLRTVKSESFLRSGIEELNFPEGTDTIEANAFWECGNIKTLTLPSTLRIFGESKLLSNAVDMTVYINCNGCYNFHYYPIVEVIFGEDVETIGKFSYSKKLTKVTLPERILEVSAEAFLECGLTTITIPKNVDYIGHGAFYCENLETVYMEPVTPPTLQEPQYDANFYFASKIYVPKESVEAYSTRADWNYLWDKIVAWEK